MAKSHRRPRASQSRTTLGGPLNLVAGPLGDGQSGFSPDLGLVPPTVTKIEPSEGGVGGGTAVKITGTGFTEGTLVKIGSSATEVEYKSATELKAKTAATAAGKDEVFVTDSKGVNSSGPDFTYLAAPHVTSVAPKEGTTAGGTSVKLTGTGFLKGAKVKIGTEFNEHSIVTIGSEVANVEYISATELVITTSAHVAGKVEVVVTNGELSSSGGPMYTYV